jgi:diguanylate cyclase (GGDEF)-like protein
MASWLTTVATLIVAGVFIDTLVARARRHAGAAAATATTLGHVTELGHQLGALSEPGAVRLAICQGSVRITGACRGFLWEPTGQGGPLRVTSGAGGPTQDRVPFGGPSAGVTEAFHTGRPVTRLAPTPALDRPRPAGDQPCVAWRWHPIVHERRTMAVLELSWDDPTRLEDPTITTFLNLLSVDIAVNLQRVELLRELEATARTDELTALPNRRAWQEQLPRELTRAGRREEPLSMAMLDLDHFKRYNDTRGHQTGDELLMQVAARWSLELRPTDILARYGGEEFVLALPACPLEEALEVVERLRAAMPDDQSCSAGVAGWDGSETAAALLDRADRALYRAKRSGRNHSAVAGRPAQTETTAAG